MLGLGLQKGVGRGVSAAPDNLLFAWDMVSTTAQVNGGSVTQDASYASRVQAITPSGALPAGVTSAVVFDAVQVMPQLNLTNPINEGEVWVELYYKLEGPTPETGDVYIDDVSFYATGGQRIVFTLSMIRSTGQVYLRTGQTGSQSVVQMIRNVWYKYGFRWNLDTGSMTHYFNDIERGADTSASPGSALGIVRVNAVGSSALLRTISFWGMTISRNGFANAEQVFGV